MRWAWLALLWPVGACFLSVPDLLDETKPVLTCEPGTAVACFTGPPASRDVGACVSGTGACAEDGSGVTVCSGQVLPAVERCVTEDASDEDCDGTVNDHCALWSFSFGAALDDRLQSLTLAPDGPISVGSFKDRVELGDMPYENPQSSNTDGFVAHHDMQGAHVWSVHVTGNGVQLPRSVSLVEQTAWVAGAFSNTVIMGAEQVYTMANRALFVAKLDINDGTPTLLTRIGSTAGASMTVDGLAAHAAGAVIVGDQNGSVTYGGLGDVTTPNRDAFVLSVDEAGDPLWVVTAGGAQTDRARAVALDADGGVYVTGALITSLDLGCPEGELAGHGDEDAYLAKLSLADGSCVWSLHLGSAGVDRGRALAFDGQDVLWGVDIGGALIDAVAPGLEPLQHAGDLDVLLLRVSPEGVIHWQRSFGDEDKQEIFAIAAAPGGGILAGGSLAGSPDLGEGAITSANAGDDAWVVRLDAAGDTLWARTFGGDGDDDTLTAAIDADDNVFIGGEVAVSMDLGAGLITGNAIDAFLARIGP